MAIALRHLLVLRITRFFSKILAFNRWIKCYSGPPASLILGERKLIEKKYGNRPKVEKGKPAWGHPGHPQTETHFAQSDTCFNFVGASNAPYEQQASSNRNAGKITQNSAAWSINCFG